MHPAMLYDVLIREYNHNNNNNNTCSSIPFELQRLGEYIPRLI